jgi:diguanylate cyclase (GGDEF)-like protein
MAGLIGQVEQQAAQLETLAEHDPLTGAANRRAWDRTLPVEMDRAGRAGTPLAVALLDLDHFKAFNDTDGHQAGDQLLRRATATWPSRLRASDLLARYGGEEFAVLLPTSTLGQAVEVIDRLRVATPLARPSRPGSPCGPAPRPATRPWPAPTTPSTKPNKPAATRSGQPAPRQHHTISTTTPPQ